MTPADQRPTRRRNRSHQLADYLLRRPLMPLSALLAGRRPPRTTGSTSHLTRSLAPWLSSLDTFPTLPFVRHFDETPARRPYDEFWHATGASGARTGGVNTTGRVPARSTSAVRSKSTSPCGRWRWRRREALPPSDSLGRTTYDGGVAGRAGMSGPRWWRLWRNCPAFGAGRRRGQAVAGCPGYTSTGQRDARWMDELRG
jgi:hypothetical protein